MNDERTGCSAILLRVFGGGSSATAAMDTDIRTPPPEWTEPPPARASDHRYRLRDDFVSRAEASFFHTLRTVVGDGALIFPKVNLADLLYAPRQRERLSAWNRINRKHIDFVLCDPRTLAPVLAVELDDRSHRRPDRAERDAFLDDAWAVPGCHCSASLRGTRTARKRWRRSSRDWYPSCCTPLMLPLCQPPR